MSEVIKDVSLALSGAGFKFVAHLGALKAIENDHREVKEISGVSGGAVVAGLYSCGLSVDAMTRVMMTKDWRPLYQYNPLNLLSCGGLVSGDEIYSYLKEVTEGKTFRETNIPLYIIATNLSNGEEFLFSRDTTPDVEVATAIRASISVPGVFCPVKLGDNVLVDGVVINSLPIHHLKNKRTQKVGVKLLHTGSEHGPHVLQELPDGFKLPLEIVKHSLYVMADKHDEWIFTHGYVDNVVRVPTQYAHPLDAQMPLDVRKRLYKDCYKETKKFLEAAEAFKRKEKPSE